MQLDDMRIFVATVDAHNFTAAAKRLALSKQFVSRRVRAGRGARRAASRAQYPQACRD
ncbi:MAG: Transcriptional regulator, LysR family [uncultured Paraburkholderia sp.]|nr:MAG: Transcriptional regulator, LysR family [uncultured Paraburkholderia sp.]CAH2784667.1 MAG: Transcriptional regulator, LysR family [uncultured Paraburkholderia sp.]CAH2918217.1 MAG: Transcriptional regulator, LysR family [uncultured Paraburkholderia sp.]CAH2919406.1 MAG: Transcriptional regulator, LysR family [uncultured Paraburkholderia sp.]